MPDCRDARPCVFMLVLDVRDARPCVSTVRCPGFVRQQNIFLTKSKKGLFLPLPYLWPMDQSIGFMTISTPFFETAFVQSINFN